jgi:hypothetical protein
MCRGKSGVKADIFVDFILGDHRKEKSKDDEIAWKSPRLILAVRHLIFFSEIFPK